MKDSQPQETLTSFAFVGEAGLRNLVLYPEDTQVMTQRPERLCGDLSLEKATQGFLVVCVASTLWPPLISANFRPSPVWLSG